MQSVLGVMIGAAAAAGAVWAAHADEGLDSSELAGLAPACYVDVSSDEDGLIVSAWSEPLLGGSYRLTVSHNDAGGGFDLVQQGAIPADEYEAVRLSDMYLDVDSQFSASLETYDASGSPICHWG